MQPIAVQLITLQQVMPDVTLRLGQTLLARVAERHGDRGILMIAGQPLVAQLPENVRPGELLALLNTGAYTIAQMFPYNGRPLPAVALVREGGAVELIRRRDTYEDLLTSEVW